MRAYSEGTAAVFSELWGVYSAAFAAGLLRLFEHEFDPKGRLILDVGCGAGDLLWPFLACGWSCIGVDPSDHMLERASRAAASTSGTISFHRGSLCAIGPFSGASLVTCIYDTLNHAESDRDIENFFGQARDVLVPGGLLIFDFNTRQGLYDWNRIKIVDKPDVLLVSRGVFDEDRGIAYKRFSGCAVVNGELKRFQENIHNIVIEVEFVSAAIARSGFRLIRFATPMDLQHACLDPQREDRAVCIAQRF